MSRLRQNADLHAIDYEDGKRAHMLTLWVLVIVALMVHFTPNLLITGLGILAVGTVASLAEHRREYRAFINAVVDDPKRPEDVN